MDAGNSGWQKQYKSVQESAGLLDLSGRGKIRVSGDDRVTFLHSMISNDVNQLSELAGRYATFLTHRGKMIADFYLYKFSDHLLLDVAAALRPALQTTLEKFIIMDDVTLEDESQKWEHLSLQGPQSQTIVADLFQVDPPEEDLQVLPVCLESFSGWLIRRNQLATVGFEILLPPQSPSFKNRTLRSFAEVQELDADVVNVLRLEQGIPCFGTDMDETNYPMEARLSHAISLTKGCYVGQEVVSKATHIGGVARLLTRLKIEADSAPPAGSSVFSQDERNIGTITSSTVSPRLSQPIALAYLKSAEAEPGARHWIEPSPGRRWAAEVVEKFLNC